MVTKSDQAYRQVRDKALLYSNSAAALLTAFFLIVTGAVFQKDQTPSGWFGIATSALLISLVELIFYHKSILTWRRVYSFPQAVRYLEKHEQREILASCLAFCITILILCWLSSRWGDLLWIISSVWFFRVGTALALALLIAIAVSWYLDPQRRNKAARS